LPVGKERAATRDDIEIRHQIALLSNTIAYISTSILLQIGTHQDNKAKYLAQKSV